MKQIRQVIKFFILERVAVFILPKVEGYVSLSPLLLGFSLIFSSLAGLGTGKTSSWLVPDFLTIVAESILHYFYIYAQGNAIESKI